MEKGQKTGGKPKHVMKRLTKKIPAATVKTTNQKKTSDPSPKIGIVVPDVRKMADIEKKLGTLQIHKDKLKQQTEKLSGEVNKVKCDLNMSQQERGRMQQFWQIAEMNLETEKEKGRDVEKTMFCLKTQQANHVQKLQQKIRSLVLSAKTNRHASTQSDPIAPNGFVISAECQTMEEISKEKAANILRQSDDLLTAFISELEKEKLNAQSDLKYAVVQLEQRMKEEMETQMRTMREEREIEIEEIGLKHIEQIRSIESAHDEETSHLQGKIEFLQKEVENLRDLRDGISTNLADCREKIQEQAVQLGQSQGKIDEMSKELTRLQDYKKAFQRDMRNLDSMRAEVEKYKELNEIIMGEFFKNRKRKRSTIRRS
ncbi:unnamed protein product [Caenorhabditis angaria]|uniref:Uncharacterized protein n=1 Tax=Caenorhabditis angaria TaxID=860376 RepID=A0A9P1N8T2_9PELO|nr:unnamed protein product [Caenorhabditis angaria]